MLLDEKKPDDFTFDEDDLEDLSMYPSFDKELPKQELSELPEDLEPDEDKDENEEDRSIMQELFSYIKILCVAIVAALFINNFVVVNASIPTGSMNNTIMEGDHLIGFRLAYLFSEPQRGDIIIFKYPDNPSEKFVKRVIGLPGDVVKIKTEDGVVNVYVNDQKLNEPYLKEAMRSNQDSVFIVPSNSYFVIGDNRNDSKDSRYWKNTYVPEDYILAKAIFKYLDEFEIFEAPKYE